VTARGWIVAQRVERHAGADGLRRPLTPVASLGAERPRSPDLPVRLREDSGTLLGLVFALVGVLLTLITGKPVFDGIGRWPIGVLLICVAVVLAIEMRSSSSANRRRRSSSARSQPSSSVPAGCAG